jgi:hypothetical protein
MRLRPGLFYVLPVVWLAAACGNKNKECTVGDACDNGQVCESYTDTSGTHAACFAPTTLKGKITNAQTGAAVQGARVIAIDGDTHAAVSAASISDASGNYEVRITAPRMSGVDKAFTLRVSAAGFEEFPSGIRVALPIMVAFADPQGAAAIDGPQDVALSPLSPAPAGSIAGKVSGMQAAGVLVVADNGTNAISSVSDSDGNYVLFNVPDGTYAVRGYFVGVNYAPADGVVVAGARKDGVDLAASGAASGALTGTLSYVAGAGTSTTTAVVLRLKSTREVPPGLQVAAMNSTPYQLEKIPDGTYEVVAAYPNDQLVKDPDPGQAGTITPVVTFAGGNTVDVGSFKITTPVNMTAPDASAKVGGNPTFTWAAYPQTYQYKIEVFDSEGTPIWQPANIDGGLTSLTYAGSVALQPGSYYQWRITSFANPTGSTPVRPISQSEDLRGVWQQQ